MKLLYIILFVFVLQSCFDSRRNITVAGTYEYYDITRKSIKPGYSPITLYPDGRFTYKVSYMANGNVFEGHWSLTEDSLFVKSDYTDDVNFFLTQNVCSLDSVYLHLLTYISDIDDYENWALVVWYTTPYADSMQFEKDTIALNENCTVPIAYKDISKASKIDLMYKDDPIPCWWGGLNEKQINFIGGHEYDVVFISLYKGTIPIFNNDTLFLNNDTLYKIHHYDSNTVKIYYLRNP